MVKQGEFSVEIVAADTRIAFPEHTAPNGDTYVEVEPRAEYFLRIATDSERKVRVDLSVDRQKLGYCFTFSETNSPKVRGLWSYVDGKSNDIALKFDITEFRSGDPPPAFGIGEVEVTFSKAILVGKYERKDPMNNWNGGDIGYSLDMDLPGWKTGVKSGKGSQFQIVRKRKRRRNRYERGRVFTTITLRYCSVYGLVDVEIVRKPPTWEFLRAQLNYRSPEQLYVGEPLEPEMMEMTTRVHNIVQLVKVPVFDLTK